MVNRNTVNCEQVWREISNYIDGDVDAPLRASMDEHFRSCKHCASVLAGTRNVIQLYGDGRMLEVPAGFSLRLKKRLTKDSAVKRSGWSNWSAWLVPVAALVLVVGTLTLTGSSRNWHSFRSQQAEPAKDIPPDMVVVVSSGAKLFHVPGCAFIHDKASQRTLTAREAMREGYAPCPRCLRQYLKTGLTRESGEDDTAAEEQDEVLTVAGH